MASPWPQIMLMSRMLSTTSELLQGYITSALLLWCTVQALDKGELSQMHFTFSVQVSDGPQRLENEVRHLWSKGILYMSGAVQS